MLEGVRESGLLKAGTPVVAMLSGGRDSVCLLDLAVRLLGAGAVTALHVNYGLRGDSDEDEAHCAALCERLGPRLEVERPRRPDGPGNLQAWARDARYAAAARLALTGLRQAYAEIGAALRTRWPAAQLRLPKSAHGPHDPGRPGAKQREGIASCAVALQFRQVGAERGVVAARGTRLSGAAANACHHGLLSDRMRDSKSRIAESVA